LLPEFVRLDAVLLQTDPWTMRSKLCHALTGSRLSREEPDEFFSSFGISFLGGIVDLVPILGGLRQINQFR
jgi:hypothetical protein